MAVIAINNITKKFEGNIAVDKLSLTINEGETLGLIGQNGAGKSTTFKMILNFLKPDYGDILFDGHSLSYKDLENIGFLPEERGLYEDLKIESGIKYFAQLHGYYPSNIDKKIDFWMKKLHVKGKKKDKIKTLSKGNQQKVQLISSFIHEPKLLILDEPFSGLDPVNSDLLMETIALLKKQGTAIIFSSHDMRNVSHLSDKILMLKNGKTVLQGNTHKIRNEFGKRVLYIEGDLNPSDFVNNNVTNDDEGFTVHFKNEKNAKKFLEYQMETHNITGYRLQSPSLDDIFRDVMLDN